jgi:membrane associated rhomboid family serine protease
MRRDLRAVIAFIAVIWVVFALDQVLPLELLGLIPRTFGGLTGVVAMPFLHGNFQHLMGNTIPLAITLLLLAGSRANSGAIVVLITVIGGLGLWVFGRSAIHIGASGLVFGLIAFHVFAGIFEKRFQSIAIAFVVGALYATTFIKGVIPMQEGVSWDGHLFGGIAGVLVSFVMAKVLRDEKSTTRASNDRSRT